MIIPPFFSTPISLLDYWREREIEREREMDIQQPWRTRLSFNSATILLTVLNVVTVLFFLQSFLSGASPRIRSSSSNQFTPVQLRYIKESEEIRLAMQPWDLIKRVKEIQQESFAKPETVQQKETPTQTAAVDLSKRLKDLRTLNDGASTKALEEWRKRKMERARQREMEKNGTVTSQV